jgi:hypothetical protein
LQRSGQQLAQLAEHVGLILEDVVVGEPAPLVAASTGFAFPVVARSQAYLELWYLKLTSSIVTFRSTQRQSTRYLPTLTLLRSSPP